MANENVGRFEELLRSDESLQAKLRELEKGYEGPMDDEEAIFEATLGELAGGIGLPFSFEEARHFAFGGERELRDDELESVAGGKGFCYLIGGSNTVEANCKDIAGGDVCAYVGVSLGYGD